MENIDLWLIRTTDNILLGPYPKERILSLVSADKLNPNDEVCQANHYWFYLYEQEEVVKHLGQQAFDSVQTLQSQTADPDEEETYTDTGQLGQTKLTDINATPDQSVHEKKDRKAKPTSDSDRPIIHVPHTFGQIDKSSVWLFLFVAIIAAIILIGVTLLQLLRT